MKNVYVSVEYDNGKSFQEIELNVKDENAAKKLKLLLEENCTNIIGINIENDKNTYVHNHLCSFGSEEITKTLKNVI